MLVLTAKMDGGASGGFAFGHLVLSKGFTLFEMGFLEDVIVGSPL